MAGTNPDLRTVVGGLRFTEGPRWRDGALWCSDMHDHKVLHITPAGEVTTVAEVPDDKPSGLGWLPDGRLLVVAMGGQRLLRVEADGAVVTHADLSAWAAGDLNDMIVGPAGVAYVGDMGYRLDGPPGPREPSALLRVNPDGTVSVAADGMGAPNGTVLTDDERTLIVAESRHGRLTAFDVGRDGSLSNRRVHLELPTEAGRPFPDGICADAEGAIWWADPVNRAVTRTLPDGHQTARFGIDDLMPVACVLGGNDRRTLFICAAAGWEHDDVMAGRSGRILALDVDVPGAGRP